MPTSVFKNSGLIVPLSLAIALLTAPVARQLPASQPAPLEEVLDLLDKRADWKEPTPMEFPRHPAEKFLKDWVIVLDPGHGGDAHKPGFKRGPTGVREAEINWRVGVLLERLLSDAGAHVTLTRSGDHDVSLRERAEIANNVARPDGGAGADLFISLHHNATGNPETNYTSVWHHGEIDWSEPDIDAARYIAHSLFRHLRTDAGLTSYLMSDQLMYPSGFGVLSQTRVPAILLESSFHTNPDEEQRLADARYNLREAYAVYAGLCEYAYGGRPTQTKPAITIDGDRTDVTFEIDDGLPKGWWGADRNRTVTSTVQLFLDDEPLPSRYDPEARTVTASLSLDPAAAAAAETRHRLRVHHANVAKHHNWPQRYELTFERSEGEVISNVKVMTARRTRGDGELLLPEIPSRVSDEREKSDDEAGANESEEEEAGPLLDEATRAKIRSAKPGDIVVLDELPAGEVPALPIRLTPAPGPQLIFSDMPEYFRTGNGVALEEKVNPGLIRLYLYHVPEATGDEKVITASIENLGNGPMKLRFHRYAFPTPGGDYHRIAKRALMDFFQGNTSPPERTIEPGARAPIDLRMDSTVVAKNQLVHGFYEFEIDQPARIVTMQRDPGANSPDVVDELPRLPRILPETHASGAGRGRFEIADFLVTLPAERPIDTAGGPRQLVVGDGRGDPWIVGVDSIEGDEVKNKGNYGVMYRVRVKRTSSDGRSLAVFMHNLYGANEACRYQASAIEISQGEHPGGLVPIPGQQLHFGGSGENVLLQTFAPLPEGKSETIEILYSPPGASCLPTPIFFVPF